MLPGRLIVAFVGIAMGVFAVVVLSSRNPHIALVYYLPLFTYIVGALLVLGSARPRDARPTAGTGAAAQAAEESQISTAEAVPDGAALPKGKHRVKINLLMLVVGLALLLPFFMALSKGPSFLLRQMPTAALLDEVQNRPAHSIEDVKAISDAWLVLQERDLSDEQVVNLAEHCLNAPQLSGSEEYSIAWSRHLIVRQLIHAGRLPEEMVDRYFTTQLPLQLSIIAPDEMRAGDEVGLDIAVDLPRPSWVGERQRWAFVRGFHIGDSTVPIATLDEVIEAKRLSKCRWLRRAPGRGADCSKATIVASQPGPLTVRFVAWLAVSEQWLEGEPITWQADGTPAMPDGVLWSKRFEAEHTTQVADGTL